MACPSQMPKALFTAKPSALLLLCQVHLFLISVYKFTVSYFVKGKRIKFSFLNSNAGIFKKHQCLNCQYKYLLFDKVLPESMKAL